MAPRALLRSSAGIVLIIVMAGCYGQKAEAPVVKIETVDVSQIPATTVLQNDTALQLVNGVYYLGGKPYSGYIKDMYDNGAIRSQASYHNGLLHGTSRTYYADGKLRDERNYKEGLSYGRHLGYWENGNRKFDYTYCNEKKEGAQLRWYETGKPYMALHYKDDHEDGPQKGWRENGKPFINYEVRDGIKYGLQSSAQCYTLKNGALTAKQ